MFRLKTRGKAGLPENLYEHEPSEVPGGFTKRPLTAADAPALAALLQRQPASYLRFFSAFSADEASLAKMLGEARQDVFGGFYRGEDLVGFYMVRGWDEGYEIPAAGSFADHQLRGVYGFRLMDLSVLIAKNLSRQRGAKRIMFKSHPENTPARTAAHWDFRQTGVDERTGYLIFHCELSDA